MFPRTMPRSGPAVMPGGRRKKPPLPEPKRDNVFAVNLDATVTRTAVFYRNRFAEDRFTVGLGASVDRIYAGTFNKTTILENIPTILSGESREDWGFLIRIRLLNKSYNIPAFTVTDTLTQDVFNLAQIEEVDPGHEYILYIDDAQHPLGINDTEGDIGVAVSGYKNGINTDYDQIVETFTPLNLGFEILPPEVQAIWNE